MMVHEWMGHPRPSGKTWHIIRLTCSSRWWNKMHQSLLWSVTAVPLKQAVIPWGCAEEGWLSPATSLASSVYPGTTDDVHTGKHDQEESVGVRLRMPFHSHCSPAITFLSPNPSPTQSFLQDHTYPANSLVIPWLPFLPFQWLLSRKMESGLFLLWGAGRRGNLWTVVPLLLQHHSAVRLLC